MHKLNGTGFLDLDSVGVVWRPQIVVVGSLLHVNGSCSPSDVLGDAARVPRVVVSVDPDDVGLIEEVMPRLPSAEEIKSPIILRSHAKGLLAALGESIFVPARPCVGTLRWVIALRHRELVA